MVVHSTHPVHQQKKGEGLMHSNLLRFRSSKKIEQVPHHELLIVTHGLTIELMVSCALPQSFASAWQPFMVKEEDGKEYRIFKGLIDVYILGAPLKLSKMLIACEFMDEIADAINLSDLAPEIRDFAKFERLEGRVRIIVRGTQGISKLQNAMAEFFKKNAPSFMLPTGGDSEIYLRPDKFVKHGFKQITNT